MSSSSWSFSHWQPPMLSLATGSAGGLVAGLGLPFQLGPAHSLVCPSHSAAAHALSLSVGAALGSAPAERKGAGTAYCNDLKAY